MKIALYSDLHLETYRQRDWQLPAPDVDVLILAGDIAGRDDGLRWAAQTYRGLPVIYVAGNHEFYGEHLGFLATLRQTAKELGVHFLERDALDIDGVRFLGATLWSSFELFGTELAPACMNIANASIPDYRAIQARPGRRLTPLASSKLHRTALDWLDAELAKPHAGKTVVVSHFAPHRQCVAPQYQDSPLSPYFINDLSPLLRKHRIDLWCHGHTHTNNDFIAENGCRVIANQRGYPKEFAAGEIGFKEDLVIEL
jgi:predicted phosphodiesterase